MESKKKSRVLASHNISAKLHWLRSFDFQFKFLTTLKQEDVRNANVYAIGGVQCYTLDRAAFTNLVG